MSSIGKNHAKGTLLFQSPDGWTACSPEFAASATLDDCQPNSMCIVRRILEKEGKITKKDDKQSNFDL
jgi:hypothetical protein